MPDMRKDAEVQTLSSEFLRIAEIVASILILTLINNLFTPKQAGAELSQAQASLPSKHQI